MLESHNSPSIVICHRFDGPIPAQKITLRCKTCALNYRFDYSSNFIEASSYTYKRYEQYGSDDNGYCYYEHRAGYIKASRGTYISRSLCQLFAAAGYKNLSTTFFNSIQFTGIMHGVLLKGMLRFIMK